MFLCLISRKHQWVKRLQTLKIREKIRPMPGNFTARALIMLNFGTKVLQSYGGYSAPLRDGGKLNSCVSIRALTRKNFWDE